MPFLAGPDASPEPLARHGDDGQACQWGKPARLLFKKILPSFLVSLSVVVIDRSEATCRFFAGRVGREERKRGAIGSGVNEWSALVPSSCPRPGSTSVARFDEALTAGGRPVFPETTASGRKPHLCSHRE